MRRTFTILPCAIVASVLIACVGDYQGSESSIYAGGDAGDDAAESSDDAGEPAYLQSPDDESSGGGLDEEGDPIKFDLQLDSDAPAADQAPCPVDILFVIDNSGSMEQHKDNIVAAFDNFIAEMVTALEPDTPVHIGITRATGFFDPGNGSGWSDPSCEFGFLDGTWNPPVISTNGINGQQGRLFKHHEKTFFEFVIGSDSTMLGEWFKGALYEAIALDDSSNSESVVAAAAYSFHPVNAEANAGFLREKAVLVLFLISDAPDATPADVPTSDLIALVSAAKSGCGDACVLPTGIIQSYCYQGAENVNTRLTDFMHGFGSPPAALDFFHMNQAPESFTSALGATLAQTIAFTCENYVPEG
jgi:hypothetical protein